MVPEVSTAHIVHYEIQIIPILEGKEHIYDEFVFQFLEQLFLIHDRTYGFFAYNKGLRHLLESVSLLIFLTLDLPDLSKTTFTNHIREIKIVFRHLYGRRH